MTALAVNFRLYLSNVVWVEIGQWSRKKDGVFFGLVRIARVVQLSLLL